MSAQTETTKPKVDPAALAVVVFGRDEAGKPHASSFSASDAELAEKAAGLMGMRILRLTTDEGRELAAKLPRGRVFGSGRAFVPFVKAGLYDRLEAVAQASDGPFAAGTESAGTTPPSPPEGPVRPASGRGGGEAAKPQPIDGQPPATWDAITLGSVVLAPVAPKQGWQEAVVVKVAGDLLTLRWRDYPDDPQIVRRRKHLALLHPGGSPA